MKAISVLLSMLVLASASMEVCFHLYGDCQVDEEEWITVDTDLHDCLMIHTSYEECHAFFLTNCGIGMGCDVPSSCWEIESPWCEK